MSHKVEPRREWHELVEIMDDMCLAIKNAAWKWGGIPNLHGPTPHMDDAIAAYERWKKENNV